MLITKTDKKIDEPVLRLPLLGDVENWFLKLTESSQNGANTQHTSSRFLLTKSRASKDVINQRITACKERITDLAKQLIEA